MIALSRIKTAFTEMGKETSGKSLCATSIEVLIVPLRHYVAVFATSVGLIYHNTFLILKEYNSSHNKNNNILANLGHITSKLIICYNFKECTIFRIVFWFMK